ncbi:DUF3408 domain-containing protein [Bacteroides ovatus]|jgi:hypothetical protein|uniref:DUF3408 domain-containing protein n=1 Tax=Bacteroides TaxID=816 RepID=UPI002954B4CF|nr:DUF3408 domain-containing protein [Bacteroides ovatus]MDV7052869.1 DUF3408 domain-containing protein [Bacteroides ovatus]
MPENNKTDYNKILERVSQGIPVDSAGNISANKRSKPDERKSSTGQEELKEQGEKEKVQPIVGLPEQSETAIPPKSAEFGKRKRKTRGDYDGHFFNRVDFTYRKPLYITANTHRKLMRIVHLMDSSKATISSYVENILCHHLEVFKDDIDNIYRNNNLNPTEE